MENKEYSVNTYHQLFFLKFYNTFYKNKKIKISVDSYYENSKIIYYKKVSNINNKDKINNLLLSNKEKDYKKAIVLLNERHFNILKNTTIEFEFDGQGDSGEVYNVNHDDFFNINEHVYDWWDIVASLIEFDWYNNDGGRGSLLIDLKNGVIRVEGGYRTYLIEDCSDTYLFQES